MTPIDLFNELKDEVESLKKELARAEGAKDNLLKSIKEEHQVKTIKEAKELLATKRLEQEELQKQYEEKLREYKHERARTASQRAE